MIIYIKYLVKSIDAKQMMIVRSMGKLCPSTGEKKNTEKTIHVVTTYKEKYIQIFLTLPRILVVIIFEKDNG